MTFPAKRWQTAVPPSKEHLDQLPDVDPLLVQILYHRGVTEPAEVEAFLARRPKGSDDPFLLAGMEAAVARLSRAIRQQESIAVYGDYDADGVTATVLLVQALRAMGAGLVRPYIPDRIDEGYGLNLSALKQLAEEGHKAVITVDCGIRAVGQVKYANELGLDIIITDHHNVGTELPPATAIIDPKQLSDTYPDRELAGVGVAFKLVQGLLRSGLHLKAVEEDDLLDLVALGTVADMAPLRDENRAIVFRGLEIINQERRPGIAALLKQAGVRPGQVTASTIGYALGPRINAAGRVDHAYQAARLLISEDPTEAERLAGALNDLNRKRQDLTHEMTIRAEELARQQVDLDGAFLLFAADPEFPSGIAGLIASRVMETHYRPVIVAQKGPELTVGSCRSIPEFHITEALDQCKEILVKHGGHRAAAGFTVETTKLPLLQERLTSIAEDQLRGQDLTAVLSIDAELALSDIIWEVQESLARLEPCGYANPTPLLLSRDVQVHSSRTVGKDGSHLKMELTDGDRRFDAIAFRMGHLAGELQERMDIVYHLEENEWGGVKRLQLNIQDMAIPDDREQIGSGS